MARRAFPLALRPAQPIALEPIAAADAADLGDELFAVAVILQRDVGDVDDGLLRRSLTRRSPRG